MAISDGHGLPLAVHMASASPHETKLVGPTLEQRSWWLRTTPLDAKQQHKMAARCAATGVVGRSSVCSRGSITIGAS